MDLDPHAAGSGDGASLTVLELTPDIGELERVYAFIERFRAAHGLAPAAGQVLMLAAEELLVNTIGYGNLAAEAGCLRLGLGRDGSSVVMELRDNAPAFDPFATARPDLSLPVDSRPVGGLGVHLVREMTDRQEYQRDGDWNVTRVYKTMDEES